MSAEKGLPEIEYDGRALKIKKVNEKFMRLVEEQNLVRVKKLQRVRRNNLITAGVLVSSVLGIYGYSILSVKQESFLDDFDEPKKISN